MAKVLSKNLKSKEHPMDRYLKLVRGICGKKKINYEDDPRLFYAILGFNEWQKEQSIWMYMDEVVEYDKNVGNKKRIDQWSKLKQRNMSESEILMWAHEEFHLEMNRLIEEIKQVDFKQQQKKGSIII